MFSKRLMQQYHIPTAAFAAFDDQQAARDYAAKQPCPMVVKADGLALGKGVFICQTAQDALDAIDAIMVQKKFGQAGARVVIEEFLTGPEVSLLCFLRWKNRGPHAGGPGP